MSLSKLIIILSISINAGISSAAANGTTVSSRPPEANQFLRSCQELLANKLRIAPSHSVLIVKNLTQTPILDIEPGKIGRFEVHAYNPHNGALLLVDHDTSMSHSTRLEEIVKMTRATAKLEHPEVNHDVWLWYELDFQRHTVGMMRKSQGVYRKALRNGDLYVEFLKSLGFGFQSGVKAPSLRKIMTELENRIMSQINGVEITEKDVLIPARVFSNVEGKQIYLRHGEQIPQGFRPLPSLLKLSELTRMLAHGFFPIGEHHNGIIGGQQTSFMHDLAHWAVFVRYPKIAKALRQAFKRLHEARLALDPESSDPTIRLRTVRMDFRMSWALEWMTFVSRENHLRLVKLLELPRLMGQKTHTVTAVEAHLRALDKTKLVQKMKQVLAAYEKSHEALGGGAGDLFSIKALESRAEELNDQERYFFSELAHELRRQLSLPPKKGGQPVPNEVINAFARFQIAMLYGIAIPPERWIEGMLHLGRGLPPELHRFLLETEYLGKHGDTLLADPG